MALTPGTRIGAYEIVAPLGQGGMGEVYRAIDTRLSRPVALKILPASVDGDAERERRFEVEARAVAELSHPNILTIHEFGRDGRLLYAALELVEGATLGERLLEGPLPARKAVDIARQIARALAAAHAAGILHRDIKPGNVMLTADGHVKVLDFGLARRIADAKDDGTASLVNLTEDGTVLGTIGYMAPEQVRGGAVDERTDIFALGAVLYEMLCGRAPFARGNRAETLAAILRDDPEPLPPTVAPALRRIVTRCLEKTPAERYQSANDLALTLEAVADGTETEQRWRAVPRARPWLRQVAAGLVAAGLLTWLGWVVRSRVAPAGPADGPSFVRVTYRRGSVFEGRFRPGSEAVVIGAAWEGRPPDVYEIIPGSRDARPLGPAPALPLALSTSGEMAVLLAPEFPLRASHPGQLAVAAPSGAPRIIADGVSSADWGPDGRTLALARIEAGQSIIEWPAGQRLAERSRRVTSLRVSPDGEYIAWIEGDTEVMLATRDGQVRRIASAAPSPGGLAWAAGGREVWFTAGRTSSLGDLEIRAVSLDGNWRQVLSVPGGVRLLDIAPDGRVLLTHTRETVELHLEDGQQRFDLGWFTSSQLVDLSDDGRWVLFSEDGPSGFDLYLRSRDGRAAVKLIDGLRTPAARLSPDASRLVVTANDGRLALVPVGAGNQTSWPVAGTARAWFPDGRRVLVLREGQVSIAAPDEPERVIEGLRCAGIPVLSNRGDAVACGSGQAIAIATIGGAVRQISIRTGVGQLIGWRADDRMLFGFSPGAIPQSVQGIDLGSGEMSDIRRITVPDAAGAWRIRPVRVTPDGRTIAYSVSRQLDDVYVYTGLR